VVQLLSDVRQPDHPWRARLDDLVEGWIDRLASDAELRARGEALKEAVLANPRFRAEIARLWRQLRRQLESGSLEDPRRAQAKVEGLVCAFGDWLSRDAGLQRMLNLSARALVRSLLAPRRQEIGRFVAQVVEGWDSESVVSRLELQVGPDLQFIRVNGALVGGLVGLMLFAASRLFHLA
jgi:uncharacterized membrane-anchored protein YjiN (DUF445 family)